MTSIWENRETFYFESSVSSKEYFEDILLEVESRIKTSSFFTHRPLSALLLPGYFCRDILPGHFCRDLFFTRDKSVTRWGRITTKFSGSPRARLMMKSRRFVAAAVAAVVVVVIFNRVHILILSMKFRDC